MKTLKEQVKIFAKNKQAKFDQKDELIKNVGAKGFKMTFKVKKEKPITAEELVASLK